MLSQHLYGLGAPVEMRFSYPPCTCCISDFSGKALNVIWSEYWAKSQAVPPHSAIACRYRSFPRGNLLPTSSTKDLLLIPANPRQRPRRTSPTARRRGPMAGSDITAGGTISAYLHDTVDIQQNCRISFITTNLLYNTLKLKMTGNPNSTPALPSTHLTFDSAENSWRNCGGRWKPGHAVLTAPRRTGKTSVMDYLRDNPERGFSVVSINVQDLTHPADFFLVLLDALHDAYPDFVRDQLAKGWALLSGVLGNINEVGVGGFKIALRGGDPDWRANWRQHGDTFLSQARATGVPILLIVDEFPDMLLNLSRADGALLREFLAWFRTQRQKPAPARDSVRWLVGGSVNLAGTLDALGMVDLINDLEDVALPPLTDVDVEIFVKEMLGGRVRRLRRRCSATAHQSAGPSHSTLHADGDL